MSSHFSVACAFKKRQNFHNEFESLSISSSSSSVPLFPSSSSSSSSVGRSSSSAVSNRWTLWSFDCRDFPKHCTTKTCAFCVEVNKLRLTNKDSVDETNIRWDTYLKRENSYEDEQTLLKVTSDSFLPSKMAKTVFFNHKLGVAIFREDIPPKYESAENMAGGIFQLQLLATSGRQSVPIVQKFDALFTQIVRLLFALPTSIVCHVYGVFYRCELNPGKWRTERGEQPTVSYDNLLDLPFIAKFEIWINKTTSRQLVEESLIEQLNRVVALMEIRVFRPFRFRTNCRAISRSRDEKGWHKN